MSKLDMNLPDFNSLFSSEETRRQIKETDIVEIPLQNLHDFKDHPFRVVDDEEMEELIQNIRENGVLTPALVRNDDERGDYEMISGHRRKYACWCLRKDTMPCIILPISHDEAVRIMISANKQRQEILPSELAAACAMAYEVVKRKQGAKANKESENHGRKSREIVAEELGMSPDNVRRYLCIYRLIPELLELIDKKQLSLRAGVELSYLGAEQQEILHELMQQRCIRKIGQAQAEEIRVLSQRVCAGSNEYADELIKILKPEKPAIKNVTLKRSDQRFRCISDMPEKQMLDFLAELVEAWYLRQNENK